MEIEKLIDQELPPPHGNRQGLSYGQLAVLLLTYMISQGDHRLCAVEPWVAVHHRTLEWTTGWKIGLKDAVVLEKKVTEILHRYRVTDYLVPKISSKIHYDKVYESGGRPSKNGCAQK